MPARCGRSWSRSTSSPSWSPPTRPRSARRWWSCWRASTSRRRGAGSTRCCWPSRWRSAPGAFVPCSCAACRRASSRARPAPSRSCPTSAASSWPPRRGLRLRAREDALAAERYLFYAALSRATERVFLAYRSSDEEGNLALPSPFIADVAELLADDWPARAGAGCWPTSSGSRTGRPPRASALAPLADRGAAAGGEPPARSARSARAGAESRCATPRSSPPARSRPTPTARCAGWSSASFSPSRWTRSPSRWRAASLMHDVLERVLRRARRPGDAATRWPGAQAILDRLLAELAADGGAALGVGSPEVVRAGGAARDRGRPAALPGARGADRRAVAAAGARAALRLRGRRGLAAGARARRGRRSRAGAWRGRPRRRRRRGPCRGARLQVRRATARAGRRPAGPRTASSRSRCTCWWCASSPARQPVAGFYQPLRGDDLRARGRVRQGDDRRMRRGRHRRPRAARSSTTMLADAAERAVALAAALRAGELEPCPQNCSRDGCRVPGDLPQPVSVSPPLDPPSVAGGDEPGPMAAARLPRPPARGRPSSSAPSSAAPATCCWMPVPAAARPRCWSSASSSRS